MNRNCRGIFALCLIFFVSGCNLNSPDSSPSVRNDIIEPSLELVSEPEAFSVNYRTEENLVLILDLESSGDNLVYEISGQPLNGSIYPEIENSSIFMYEPFECFTGEDEFSFTVANSAGQASATNKIEVLKSDTDDGPVFKLPLLNLPLVSDYLGRFSIDSFAGSKIVFSVSEGDIRDNELYDRRVDNFNYDGLYERKSLDGDVSYFRFGWQDFQNSNTRFHYVKWANGKKPNTLDGMFDISVANKDICQTGSVNLTIVGDSITWWSNGQHLRRLLHKNNESFNFIGSRTDGFGYGHEGEGGDNSQEVVNRLDAIVESDIYILMVGTNDRNNDISITLNNIKMIVNGLIKKSSDSVVYVSTILPRNDAQDLVNIGVNKLIREWLLINQDERIRIMDLEVGFRSLENWKDLLPDGLHPSLAGYYALSELISEGISNYE